MRHSYKRALGSFYNASSVVESLLFSELGCFLANGLLLNKVTKIKGPLHYLVYLSKIPELLGKTKSNELRGYIECVSFLEYCVTRMRFLPLVSGKKPL